MGRRECKRRRRRKKKTTPFLDDVKAEEKLVAEKLWTNSKLISNKQVHTIFLKKKKKKTEFGFFFLFLNHLILMPKATTANLLLSLSLSLICSYIIVIYLPNDN